MRPISALFLVLFGLQMDLTAQTTPVSCTGLCLQQVQCTSGATTLSGTVFAPNGTDPLPNVTVYIPNAPVDAFTPGVSCPVIGAPPSGSPLVGTTTNFDGSFQLTNVPVGANIPLVIQTGRWRRQVTVPATAACVDTAFSTRFPKNQSEGDIPKIAVATGSVDSVECVLRKTGLDDAEFTNPTGSGRVNLYEGDGGGNQRSGGAVIDTSTTSESSLMGNASVLNSYDVLMLPCEGGNYTRPAQQLANLISFTSAGGRVYSSHFAYSWMYQNPPFDKVVNWTGNNANQTLPTGIATVDTSFAEGLTLAKWLQFVGASTSYGQMEVDTIKHDLIGVNAPTQSFLALNTALGTDAKPVMQFVFDTPVKATGTQCGRVLFNEYHVETSIGTYGKTFPSECVVGAALTPQEKLLEFSLFELTADGAAATLTPATADFRPEPLGFTTAAQTFTFTNNSTFSEAVNVPNVSGDFALAGNTCGALAAGASCTLAVTFTPTALGTRTGTLTVSAGAQTLTSSLTGKGTPDIAVSATSLDFGSLDVGATKSMTVTVQSTAPAAIPFPGVTATGDFTATSNCGTMLAANASCTITVSFKPSATGARTGTLSVNSTAAAYSSLNDTLTGNGVDFTVALSPTSGSEIAGTSTTATVTMTPLAGFSSVVHLSCTTNAVASACNFTDADAVLSTAAMHTVTMATTAKYVVTGYGGVGGNAALAVVSMMSAGLLWLRRKRAGMWMRAGLLLLLLGASSLLTTGCSGKLPALNPAYTAPSSYTYTMTATDGFLVHTVTYTLNVTVR